MDIQTMESVGRLFCGVSNSGKTLRQQETMRCLRADLHQVFPQEFDLSGVVFLAVTPILRLDEGTDPPGRITYPMAEDSSVF